MKIKLIAFFSFLLLLFSCTNYKKVVFLNESWAISQKSGHIINSDSTMRFSFGNHSINPLMTIICKEDSLQKYSGAENYISSILKCCGLEDTKVLFYVPGENTLWVELPPNYIDVKPRAITLNLLDSLPYTQWIWNDDFHEENRKENEIYSNSYVNKSKGMLLVVDKLNYGSRTLACINVYQSANKMTEKLGFYPNYWAYNGNLEDFSCIDILANWIDSRREVLFKNYRLGQSFNERIKINRIKEELRQIIKLDQEPRNRIINAWRDYPQDTILHRKIAAEIIYNDSINQKRIIEILDNNELQFGEENEVVWAVIQHSSLELQEKYLPKFIKAVEEGELRGEFVAVMHDRINIWSGKLQKYGSQGSIDSTGKFVPAEIEDAENVNQRRASMGMIPLEEYIELMSK